MQLFSGFPRINVDIRTKNKREWIFQLSATLVMFATSTGLAN